MTSRPRRAAGRGLRSEPHAPSARRRRRSATAGAGHRRRCDSTSHGATPASAVATRSRRVRAPARHGSQRADRRAAARLLDAAGRGEAPVTRAPRSARRSADTARGAPALARRARSRCSRPGRPRHRRVARAGAADGRCRDPLVSLAADGDRAQEDPGGACVAVRRGPPAPWSRRGLRRPVGRVRPLPPARRATTCSWSAGRTSTARR